MSLGVGEQENWSCSLQTLQKSGLCTSPGQNSKTSPGGVSAGEPADTKGKRAELALTSCCLLQYVSRTRQGWRNPPGGDDEENLLGCPTQLLPTARIRAELAHPNIQPHLCTVEICEGDEPTDSKQQDVHDTRQQQDNQEQGQ